MKAYNNNSKGKIMLI